MLPRDQAKAAERRSGRRYRGPDEPVFRLIIDIVPVRVSAARHSSSIHWLDYQRWRRERMWPSVRLTLVINAASRPNWFPTQRQTGARAYYWAVIALNQIVCVIFSPWRLNVAQQISPPNLLPTSLVTHKTARECTPLPVSLRSCYRGGP